jgi:hypothetical protein
LNYHDILLKILDVYRDCEIQSFPIDCYSILRHYGYRIFTYQNMRDINERLYEYCRNYSEDAFRYGANRIIAYDETKSPFRIRFSIMHELGHIMLGHSKECSQNEHQANFFASNILAPRMAIHFAQCRDENDVSSCFQISREAGSYAFQNYRLWRDSVSRDVSDIDEAMYHHFYNEDIGKFIFSVTTCSICGETIYNSTDDLCIHCKMDKIRRECAPAHLTKDDRILVHIEQQFLNNI